MELCQKIKGLTLLLLGYSVEMYGWFFFLLSFFLSFFVFYLEKAHETKIKNSFIFFP